MKYFEGIDNLQALKRLYHAYAKKYHPDITNTDTNEIMSEINAQYEQMFNRIKKENNEKARANQSGYKETKETSSDFINIINALIHLNDIKIEVCGLWLWISGNTIKYKDTLKELGLRYSKGKKAWYFNGTPLKKHYHNSWSMEKIRLNYGSTVYQQKENLALES